MVRRHNEQVGLTFDDVAIGMRVFLKDLYGSEAHLNGEAATVLAADVYRADSAAYRNNHLFLG